MDTTIQIRTSNKLKLAAQKVFKKEGISMSLAFNSFLEEVAHKKSFPVQVYPVETLPADRVRSWKEEMEWELKYGKSYSSAEEMFADIQNW